MGKLNAPVKPKFISTIDDSHKRAITDLKWLPDSMEVNSKGAISYNQGVTNQFMTTSSDDSVHVWDLRFQTQQKKRTKQKENKDGSTDPLWRPMLSIPLRKMDGVSELGLTKFSLGGKEAGSAFYAGTEEGELVFADWLSTKDDEGGDTSNERVAWIARDHFRPCLALERSPFFPEVILSLGDWSFNLWY